MTPIFPRSSPTPRSLKGILWILFLTTMAATVLSFFGFKLPLYLGISLSNLSKSYLWTLITYPFVPPLITPIDSLFRLAFDLFFLWAFGLPLLERVSQKRFIILFLGSSFIAGLAASCGLALFRQPPLFAGPTPAIMAIVTVWAILHTEKNVRLISYGLRPLWIFLLVVGLNLLFDLLSFSWTQLLSNAAAVFFGYIFCLTSERARSAIPFLYPTERTILKTLEKAKHHKERPSSKIIDFKTGEQLLEEDQFMDAMLARISLHGEESLTEAEKKKMQQISERKAKKK